MALLTPTPRTLTVAEQRLLKGRVHDLTLRRRRSWGSVTVGLVTVGALWATTLVASDSGGLVITIFWTLVGGGLTAWVMRDVRREQRVIDGMLAVCRSAQRANRASVYEVRAQAYVEFEELEDEGACYAFGIANRRVVFIVGQQFYPSARFPCLAFDVVHLLDMDGNVIDEQVAKHGPKAAPVRTIPAERKRDLIIPENLEVLDVALDDVEKALQPMQPDARA